MSLENAKELACGVKRYARHIDPNVKIAVIKNKITTRWDKRIVSKYQSAWAILCVTGMPSTSAQKNESTGELIQSCQFLF